MYNSAAKKNSTGRRNAGNKKGSLSGVSFASSRESNLNAAMQQQAQMASDRTAARKIIAYRKGFPTKYGKRIDSAELTIPKESCEI